MTTRISLLALAVTALLTACASSGGDQEASAGVASTESQETGAEQSLAVPFDPVVCERFSPTGTRVSYRVCKKKSEWDRIREAARQEGQDAQRRAVHGNVTKG